MLYSIVNEWEVMMNEAVPLIHRYTVCMELYWTLSLHRLLLLLMKLFGEETAVLVYFPTDTL